ncbi:MAG: ArsA family ATPase [Deltaproteobacteria bacterium]|nr:ArsA family ATPase [Deltaproteobacteria bacterium]
MRLVLYTGKGGVGKTTTAAATALASAAQGKRTLLISADSAHSLADVLDRKIGPRPVPVAENLDAVEVDAREEMGRHWGKIRDFLVSLFRYQGIEGVVAEELALLPGAEELTTLLAVDEFARSGDYDFVVVDCAPTDTTLRLLTLPDVAHNSIRLMLKVQRALAAVVTPLAQSVVGTPLPAAEVFAEAEELLYAKLRSLRNRIVNPQTSVRLVVTTEKMVIEEARRAFTDLCLFGLKCDAVVVNRVLPEAATREPFFREWGEVQEERLTEIAEVFAPLHVLYAPLAQEEIIGATALAAHGRELFRDCLPDGVLSDARAIEFQREKGRYSVSVPLPGATLDALDIIKVEGDLLVQTATARRAIKLPRRMAALEVSEAHLFEGVLSIYFKDAPDGPGDETRGDTTEFARVQA